MKLKRTIIRFVVIALALTAAASSATAQARPDLATARLSYNLAKSQVNPQGALKEKLDALEKEMSAATQAGRSGEVRRLLAQAATLLSGKEWTDELDFANSLILRGEEVCLDPGRPAAFRLEQTYAPRLLLKKSPTVRVSLHKRMPAAQGSQRGDQVLDIAAPDGPSRDLLDEPFRFELDGKNVPDGPYILQAEIFDGDRAVGAAALTIDLFHGLAPRLAALESGLEKVRGFKDRRDDVLFPQDRIRAINRGKLAIRDFRIAEELAAAEAVLASLRSGRDPFVGRTGDMTRHYSLPYADEIMPYRVYVPKNYDGRKPFPLIIALHGLGGDQNSFFDHYGKALPALAEARGYIVAAPLGYRPDGFYGMAVPGTSAEPSVRRKLELSENDVLHVLARMREDYAVDSKRIYLMGHSMGAIGTWNLGAKYPDFWAALAPFAGFGLPGTVSAMRDIPEIVVHGDADPLLPVSFSRAMVAEMKKLGVEHRYIEVAGGDHGNIVEPNFPAVFDFFDAHRKR
jgi:poly(3-hydroxybutyrate) depolymerase